MSSLGITFARKLREFRRSKNVTQEGLANKCGLARATINRWETKGGGQATLDEVEILAEILHIPLMELLGIKPPPGQTILSDLEYRAYRGAYAQLFEDEALAEAWSDHEKLRAVPQPRLEIPPDVVEALESEDNEGRDAFWNFARETLRIGEAAKQKEALKPGKKKKDSGQ